MGPLLTLFPNPLPTPVLTRPLKIYVYRHFGVSETLLYQSLDMCGLPRFACPEDVFSTNQLVGIYFLTNFGYLT